MVDIDVVIDVVAVVAVAVVEVVAAGKKQRYSQFSDDI
jgi:hypothetical protein